jgi:hypothetical protein
MQTISYGTERHPHSFSYDGITVNVFYRADGLWYASAAGVERSYTTLRRAMTYGKKLAQEIAAAA